MDVFGAGERLEFREQLVFAEVTAIIRVCQILGIFELLGFDDAHGQLEFLSNGESFFELPPGEAWRIGDRRQCPVPEDLLSDASQENGIHAT